MKTLSLLIGSGCIISLLACVVGSWLYLQPLTIKQLICQSNQQPCPEEITQELTSLLQGESLLVTDFSFVSKASAYQIEKYHKEFPGTLVVEAKALKPSGSKTDTQQLVTQNLEGFETYLTKTLDENQLQFSDLQWDQGQNLVQIRIEPYRVLLRADHLAEDLQKVILILQHARISEIDTGIVEIDARFELVVLRTS